MEKILNFKKSFNQAINKEYVLGWNDCIDNLTEKNTVLLIPKRMFLSELIDFLRNQNDVYVNRIVILKDKMTIFLSYGSDFCSFGYRITIIKNKIMYTDLPAKDFKQIYNMLINETLIFNDLEVSNGK